MEEEQKEEQRKEENEDVEEGESSDEDLDNVTQKLKELEKPPTVFVNWEEIQPKNQIFEGVHGHSTVLYKEKLWLYGGACHGWSKNDFFCFDLKTHHWSRISPSGDPLPFLSDHCAVLFNNKMYIFGGRGHASRRDGKATNIPQPLYNDLYEYDFYSNVFKKLSPFGSFPRPRKSFVCAIFNNRLYIFAGWNNRENYNDMFYLDLSVLPLTWVELKDVNGTFPRPRRDASFVLHGNKLLMWSGTIGFSIEDQTIVHFQEMYELDFLTHNWQKLNCTGSIPPASESHCSVFHNNYFYVLGGHNGYKFFNTLYRLNIQNLEWEKIGVKGDIQPSERGCFTWEILNDEGLSILIGGFGPKPGKLDEDLDQQDLELIWNRYRDIFMLQLPE